MIPAVCRVHPVRAEGPVNARRTGTASATAADGAELFGRCESASAVAAELRVTPRTVRQWRWPEGGAQAPHSRGTVLPERLSAPQFARLEAKLRRGPPAHRFADGQRWTLKRIKVVIERLFHVGYTVRGVWKLMRRHGWSCQVLLRQAVKQDEEAIEVWSQVRPPRRTWAPTSASRTRRGRA